MFLQQVTKTRGNITKEKETKAMHPVKLIAKVNNVDVSAKFGNLPSIFLMLVFPSTGIRRYFMKDTTIFSQEIRHIWKEKAVN